MSGFELAVVVVDGNDVGRSELVAILRRLGLRSVGADAIDSAVWLLTGLDADVVLVRADAAAWQLAPLRRPPRAGGNRWLRSFDGRRLVVQVPADAPIDLTVMTLLRALGRPDAAALVN